MSALTTLGLAFSSIIERPLRSILTSLGIIIGVASVYAMLALGEGAKQKVDESLNSVGTRSFQVYRDWNRRRSSQSRPRMPFNENDILEMRAIDGVYAATGTLQRSRMTIATDYNDVSGNLVGVDPDYLKAGGGEMILGANISYADMDQKAPVAVISEGIQKRLFNGQNPVGQEVRVGSAVFLIKGVTGKPDSSISFGNDEMFVWVPLPVARNRVTGGDRFVRGNVSGVKVVGELGADLDRIEQEMDIILRRSRDIKAGAPPDYRIYSNRGWREESAKTTRAISLILAAMGSISLIVGGVGVMNIMLVSVSERTREIGLRMAVGARGSNVMMQFLTEAILLCVLSGIIGLGIGFGMFKLAVKQLEIEISLGPVVPLIAFGSALFIGLVFGFLPARRASKLNPIEALRHE